MKKIICILSVVLMTQTACDLQPKIMSLPDSVGDFISARYPALLADPNTHPEIYNSAATDYDLYASPDLYGGETSDDYVIYASVDDYIVPPQVDSGAEIVADAATDDYLVVPMYGGTGVDIAKNDNMSYNNGIAPKVSIVRIILDMLEDTKVFGYEK